MAQFNCILQCGTLCENNDNNSLFNISLDRWETIKKQSKLWKGLDKFSDVFDSVDWDNGPAGKCMHDSCRLKIMTNKKLQQAIKRKEKQDKQSIHESEEASSSQSEEPMSKCLRSSLGVIHEKYLCVWCRKDHDTKHKGTELYLLSDDSA